MVSLRQLAQCIGLSGPFSVVQDFFGFFQGSVPPDPTGTPSIVSLLEQARLLQGPHFHLNVILVGIDNFTNVQLVQVDYCVLRIRRIYSQVGVGVGRVELYGIDVADAGGFDNVTSDGQVNDLANRWRVPNNAIGVLIPQTFNVPGGLLGRSAKPGPCEGKTNRSKDLNASVVGPQAGNNDGTSRTFAHEVGHYFGLEHRNTEPNSLMCQTGFAANVRTSVALDATEKDVIERFCLTQPAC